jgi:beta-carotene hydroxylase
MTSVNAHTTSPNPAGLVTPLASPHRLLSHPEDLHCVVFHSLVLASYVIAFWIYLHPERAHLDSRWRIAAFIAASAMMLGWISGIDIGINYHNHAHRPIFRSLFLNRWFARLWTFSGGWPAYFWRHAHVSVHHVNLLHPERDWTMPRRRAEGAWENMYLYLLLHWPWRYGKHLWQDFSSAAPVQRRVALKEFLIFLALWSIPFWIDFRMALLLWLLPHWVANAFAMGPGMWVQHERCVEKTDERPESHSNDHLSRWFNLTTFNIGYHIEHHDFPHVHWSELPQLHERMKPELEQAGANLEAFGYYGAARRAYGYAGLSALVRRLRKIGTPSTTV